MRSACSYLVGLFCLAIVVRTWVAMGVIEPASVQGASMAPTLNERDHLWIDRASVNFQSLRRWQVVVLRSPVGGELCVKRIVGLPGEQIALSQGKVVVNGVMLEHPLANPRRWHEPVSDSQQDFYYTPRASGQPFSREQWQLANDELFVLGDNSPVSLDSRLWGPVPRRLIVGIAIGVR